MSPPKKSPSQYSCIELRAWILTLPLRDITPDKHRMVAELFVKDSISGCTLSAPEDEAGLDFTNTPLRLCELMGDSIPRGILLQIHLHFKKQCTYSVTDAVVESARHVLKKMGATGPDSAMPISQLGSHVNARELTGESRFRNVSFDQTILVITQVNTYEQKRMLLLCMWACILSILSF